MSVSKNDIIQSAKRLVTGEEEIDWRNSASRAYYAMFHACKEVADAYGLKQSPARATFTSHESLSNRFGNSGPVGREIESVLKARKRIRVAADYQISTAFQKDLAVSQIDIYEELRARLDVFPANPPV